MNFSRRSSHVYEARSSHSWTCSSFASQRYTLLPWIWEEKWRAMEEISLWLKTSSETLVPVAVAHQTTRQPSASSSRGRGRGSRRFGTSSSRGRDRQYSTEPTCYNCRGRGHTSRQCPSPNYKDNQPKPQANYTTSPHASDKNWVVDTGASHHLTFETSAFTLSTTTLIKSLLQMDPKRDKFYIGVQLRMDFIG